MRTRILALVFALALGAGAAWFYSQGNLPQQITQLLKGGPEKAVGQGGAGAGSAPPAQVTASQPVRRPVVEWDEYVGRFEAVDTVEIRARVNGYLTEVHVVDGQEVDKGDLLYTIDPRPLERAVALAKAELEQARVKVANAQLDVDRGRPLVDRKVISEKTFDDRASLVRDAEAQVRVADARLKAAELELSYARITAPVAGRMGRSIVTTGNWVSGGASSGATLLSTIVSQDPIQVYFDVSEANALKYKRQAAARSKNGPDALKGIAVGIALPDEHGFPHTGRLDFVDNRLDAGTATLRVRAIVDNKSGLFSPGMFGRVRVSVEGEKVSLLVPDEAIGTDQASRFVYVAGADGKAERRAVRLGPLADGLRIVREGVQPEDWIIVRGVQRVRPGQALAVKREPITVSDVTVDRAVTPVTKR